MRKGDEQLGSPAVPYKGTKAAIEALTGISEGAHAYATDADEPGWYDGSKWQWGAASFALIRVSESGVTRYSVDDTGLAAAISDSTNGDTIIIPPGTYSDDITIPDGVAIVGQSGRTVILTGQVTLGSNSAVQNLSIIRSEETSDNVYGILAPSSGGVGYLRDCTIRVENNGTGGGYGILAFGRGFIGSNSKPGLVGCCVYGNTADVI